MEKKTRSITLHVTPTFYDQCVARAGAQRLCEWARREFETHLAPRSVDRRVLEELCALRHIVLNGLPTVVSEHHQATVAVRIDAVRTDADMKKAAMALAILTSQL